MKATRPIVVCIAAYMAAATAVQAGSEAQAQPSQVAPQQERHHTQQQTRSAQPPNGTGASSSGKPAAPVEPEDQVRQGPYGDKQKANKAGSGSSQ